LFWRYFEEWDSCYLALGFDMMGVYRSRRTLMPILATELVERLQELIQEHGNLLVIMDDESTPEVEYNEEDGEPAFVIS
jgi:hypothetical protein